jgi:hypothetical protein
MILYGVYDAKCTVCRMSQLMTRDGCAFMVGCDQNSGGAIVHAHLSHIIPAQNHVLVLQDQNLQFWSPELGIPA